jgi:hypothetical protein
MIVDKKEILRTLSNTSIYCSNKMLVPFTKIPPSTPMHFATHVRTWHVARLYSVLYNEIALSLKLFRILLKMTDTMASQNTDFSS